MLYKFKNRFLISKKEALYATHLFAEIWIACRPRRCIRVKCHVNQIKNSPGTRCHALINQSSITKPTKLQTPIFSLHFPTSLIKNVPDINTTRDWPNRLFPPTLLSLFLPHCLYFNFTTDIGYQRSPKDKRFGAFPVLSDFKFRDWVTAALLSWFNVGTGIAADLATKI